MGPRLGFSEAPFGPANRAVGAEPISFGHGGAEPDAVRVRSRIAEIAEQHQVIVLCAEAHGARNLGVQIDIDRFAGLVFLGDGDKALAGEDAGLGRPADGGKAAATDGAARLGLGPLHDAEEAEEVVAAIDLASASSSIVVEANRAHAAPGR